MKNHLSAACLILTMAGMASAGETTRAVQINRGTFRAVARSQSSAPAAAPTTVSFTAPANNGVTQAANFSQAGRGFTPVNSPFNQARLGSSGSNSQFTSFRNPRSLRRTVDPDPAAPAEGPQPVAGALIRTAGSGYKVTAGGPFGVNAVDGGSQFLQDKAGGQAIEGWGLGQAQTNSAGSGSSQNNGSGTVDSPLGSALSK